MNWAVKNLKKDTFTSESLIYANLLNKKMSLIIIECRFYCKGAKILESILTTNIEGYE